MVRSSFLIHTHWMTILAFARIAEKNGYIAFRIPSLDTLRSISFHDDGFIFRFGCLGFFRASKCSFSCQPSETLSVVIRSAFCPCITRSCGVTLEMVHPTNIPSTPSPSEVSPGIQACILRRPVKSDTIFTFRFS